MRVGGTRARLSRATMPSLDPASSLWHYHSLVFFGAAFLTRTRLPGGGPTGRPAACRPEAGLLLSHLPCRTALRAIYSLSMTW
jgi:hypothetical protein